MFPNQRFGEASTRTLLIPCVIALKLPALPVRILEENTLNATTQQFITAEISGCMSERGSKTHSSPRQQFTTAKSGCANVSSNTNMCPAGSACTHSGSQDRILLNYTRNENAHKVRKKTFVFLLYIEVQQTFTVIFLFPCWDIIKYLNGSMLITAVFELVQQFCHATEIAIVANALSACAYQQQPTK